MDDFNINKDSSAAGLGNENNGAGPGVGFGGGQNTPPAPPAFAPAPLAPKEETVTMTKEAWDKLMARVDSIADENKKLLDIADKGRLAHWESTHKGSIAKSYHLNVYGDKVILGWQMTENRVWKDPEGKWREKQDIALALEDGTKIVLPYVEFISNTNRIEATLVSTESKGEKTYLNVETKDGKKFTIDSIFIN